MVPDDQHRRGAAERPGAAQRDLLRPVRHQGEGRVQQLQQREHAEVGSYIKGDPKRQEILEVALDWVASSQAKASTPTWRSIVRTPASPS